MFMKILENQLELLDCPLCEVDINPIDDAKADTKWNLCDNSPNLRPQCRCPMGTGFRCLGWGSKQRRLCCQHRQFPPQRMRDIGKNHCFRSSDSRIPKRPADNVSGCSRIAYETGTSRGCRLSGLWGPTSTSWLLEGRDTMYPFRKWVHPAPIKCTCAMRARVRHRGWGSKQRRLCCQHRPFLTQRGRSDSRERKLLVILFNDSLKTCRDCRRLFRNGLTRQCT